ncbi:activating signal cointegrator 1 complex subunit 2 homolog [Mytilus trossulus]|uniref:activating signal cointegrator 1 complex subunit 2 homolog n=1 Tax=Mytilus trossulus TaxID=6551 RepID=UPI0030059A62
MEVTHLFIVICLSYIEEISCNCGGKSDGSQSESCWYTFWYIWVALALFVAVLITIMVFYYKHKSRHRTRVRRLSAARPQNPPPYSVPSQLPPSYDDAIKDSLPVPPGYVTDYRLISQYHNNRGQSDVSTISYPPSYIEGPVPQPPRQQLTSQPRPTRNSVNPQRQQPPPPRNQVPTQSQQAQTGRVHVQSQRQQAQTRVTQPQQPTPR